MKTSEKKRKIYSDVFVELESFSRLFGCSTNFDLEIARSESYSRQTYYHLGLDSSKRRHANMFYSINAACVYSPYAILWHATVAAAVYSLSFLI